MRSLGSDRPFLILLAVVLATALLLAISIAIPFGLSPYLANAIGQLATFAVLALSLDLIWGYLGILSLGHGLFFGIGGYVVAMHLLRHSYEVTGKVPDFMQFMGLKEFPFYWTGLGYSSYAILVAAAVTLLIAGVFGYVSFRSRVGGVYFAIITQALVYVAMLLMFRNDTGFGGNNGMTGFTVMFGWSIGDNGVVIAMAACSVLVLGLTLLGCRLLLESRFGILMIATRDDEVRLRTLGYDTCF